MKFKKLNVLQKIFLKQSDRKQYKDYKFLESLQRVSVPKLKDASETDVHFKHSGHIGDIIYAMPCMYALAKGKNIHLHLQTQQQTRYENMRHHHGNFMLTESMIAMLQPLMLKQKGFQASDQFQNQSIDYDLDNFREYPFDYKMGSISRWYFLTFGVSFDLSEPWMQVQADTSFKDAIVISRSLRYRTPGINYQFLGEFPRIVFVGLHDEFADMQKSISKLEYAPVKDFLQLASIIAGAKLFIGNQSFPFSLAEALKVKRILEVYHQSPNVIVTGADGYDFCYQPQFEKIVHEVYSQCS